MLVAVDPPARGFAKISDFFPSDLSKWNLGENFGFVKFKIFEWKLVFPLIFADDFFEMFHSRIFWNCVGGISFSDKLGGIAGDFIFGVRHFRRGIHWLQILLEWGIYVAGAEFFEMKSVNFGGKRGGNHFKPEIVFLR